VAPVHGSGWKKADILLWRPAPSTLFLGGRQQPPCSFMQARQNWSPPCRGSVGGMPSYGLILSPMQDYAELSQIWSLPSRGVPREEVFWSLAVYHRSPHEAPPHDGLPCWASVFIALLGQSWAVEVAQAQVDRDTPVSSTPTVAPGSLAHKRALSRERRIRGPQ
jgi:hypothetical protein